VTASGNQDVTRREGAVEPWLIEAQHFLGRLTDRRERLDEQVMAYKIGNAAASGHVVG
jgi:hypothetical protein